MVESKGFPLPDEIPDADWRREIRKQIIKEEDFDSGYTENMRLKMQNIFFFHEDGPDVLEHLLFQCRYGQELKTPEDVTLHNFAIAMLEVLGVTPRGETRKYIDSWISKGVN